MCVVPSEQKCEKGNDVGNDFGFKGPWVHLSIPAANKQKECPHLRLDQ